MKCIVITGRATGVYRDKYEDLAVSKWIVGSVHYIMDEFMKWRCGLADKAST